MDLSNEKKRGCIWYIEDSIAQLYGDIIRIHTNPPSNNQYYNGLYPAFFFFVASTIESSNPGFGLNGHTKRKVPGTPRFQRRDFSALLGSSQASKL